MRSCFCKSVCSIVVLGIVGCSGGPSRINPPSFDAQTAADEAISLYDTDGDGQLNEAELVKCPGILSVLGAYDSDGNKMVSREEIADHLLGWQKKRIGMQSLKCIVKLNGKPLAGADIVFEPEPYLGEDIKTALGATNAAGMTSIAIPKEELPEAQQALNAMHVGTYKVRVTHPEISIPAKYNTETELGYEIQSGVAYANFDLKSK